MDDCIDDIEALIKIRNECLNGQVNSTMHDAMTRLSNISVIMSKAKNARLPIFNKIRDMILREYAYRSENEELYYLVDAENCLKNIAIVVMKERERLSLVSAVKKRFADELYDALKELYNFSLADDEWKKATANVKSLFSRISRATETELLQMNQSNKG